MDLASRIIPGEPLYTSESLIPLQLQHGFNSTKAQSELGHTIRPLEETLRDTFAWHLAAGNIEARTDQARALCDQAVHAA